MQSKRLIRHLILVSLVCLIASLSLSSCITVDPVIIYKYVTPEIATRPDAPVRPELVWEDIPGRGSLLPYAEGRKLLKYFEDLIEYDKSILSVFEYYEKAIESAKAAQALQESK